MASSTFLLLLVSITISSPLILQIHARDSQFFSKVTKPIETPTQTVLLPDKAQEQHSLVEETGPVQQPEFVPNENGYGLYGHETGLNPPEAEKYYNNDKNAAFTSEQFGNGEKETFYSNNGEKLDAKAKTDNDDLLNFDDVFDKSKYGKEETFYTTNNNKGVGDTEYYVTESQNYNNNKNGVGEERETYYNTDRTGQYGNQLGEKETDTETYYNDNRFDDNRYTDELNSRYKAYRGEPNAVRKGMSDTRFVENGRYFYDVDKDLKNQQYHGSRNAYRTQYDDVGSRGYESNDVVGNSKYDDVSYDNSGADKYEFGTMEEYEKSRLNNKYDP